MAKEETFVKGENYKLKYSKTVVTRMWRTGQPSQFEKIEYLGFYEYIGSRGSKLHFYDSNRGIDALLTKSDALKAKEAAEL